MRKSRIGIMAAIASALLAGSGCGGASPSGAGISLTIKWPSSRAIPELTQSLVIRVVGSGAAQQQTVNAPTNGAQTSNVQFTGLPIGAPLVVECYAYGAPVSGVPPLLGLAESPVTLNAATGTAVTLDLVSSIDHLAITGPGLQGGTLTLAPGASSPLTVTAYSTDVNVVPIGPGNLTFSATGTGFTLASSGTSVTVTAGAGPASGTITATESESGKSVTINVTVS